MLESMLTQRVVITRGEVFTKQMSLADADLTRDAIVKSLYEVGTLTRAVAWRCSSVVTLSSALFVMKTNFSYLQPSNTMLTRAVALGVKWRCKILRGMFRKTAQSIHKHRPCSLSRSGGFFSGSVPVCCSGPCRQSSLHFFVADCHGKFCWSGDVCSLSPTLRR